MGNINFGPNGPIEENANDYVGGFVGEQPQENANGYVGGLVGGQPQIGQFGGIFGGQTQGEVKEQAQNIGYGTVTGGQTVSKNLPAKQTFWSKFKSFLFQEIDLNQEIKIELSPKEEKVLTEVHDFLFQEISFKGFMNIFKGKK